MLYYKTLEEDLPTVFLSFGKIAAKISGNLQHLQITGAYLGTCQRSKMDAITFLWKIIKLRYYFLTIS